MLDIVYMKNIFMCVLQDQPTKHNLKILSLLNNVHHSHRYKIIPYISKTEKLSRRFYFQSIPYYIDMHDTLYKSL